MSERSLQQLEKIIHKESDADARNVRNAQKRVQQAEKALQKAAKVCHSRARPTKMTYGSPGDREGSESCGEDS